MKWALLFLVACSGKSSPPVTGSGSNPPVSGACEAQRPKLEKFYRAEAEAKEPKHVDGAVVDNTQMVLNDCVRDPQRVSACVRDATSVAEIESRCLRPIDDEGTEGNDLP